MPRISPFLALGLTAAIAGCGSSSSSSSSTSSSQSSAASAPAAPASSSAAAAPAAAGGLSVSETEFKLTPSDAQVKAGKVTVSIKNAGTVVHALEIENAGPGGKDLKSSVLQAGGSTTITANLKAGKTYQWYCPIANHKALGMKGTITVGA